MALTSEISPYNPKWPLLFTAENRRIAEGFGAELVGTHHIGSTAVPGLSAKPEIDILVVVSEHINEVARSEFMGLCAGNRSFRRPPLLSPRC